MRIFSKGLTFIYNAGGAFASKALDNIDLCVEEGDFFGLIGHTGSGKSTLIQHLNALLPVQSGELFVGEYDLKFKTKKEYKLLPKDTRGEFRTKKQFNREMFELRSKVGMVFQYPEYQLFGETVLEDVAFGLKNFFPQLDKGQVEDRVREAIERVGLRFSEVASKSPFDLSGGQKRRVAIAGIIVTKPDILVLDEPVAGLDPEGKADLMALLHELKKDWCKTIIMVSHDMDEVAQNCNRIAVLSGGKLVEIGSPAQIYLQYDKLRELRLDLPLTAYLTEALGEVGVNIESDLSSADFVDKVAQAAKEKRC